MAYKILSLDGGGIRGLFQAVYLGELQQALPRPIHECFDMVAGTSTGSIVTMGVVNGVSPAQIAEVFRSDGQKIFEKGWEDSIPVLSSVARPGPKYSTEPLRKALHSVLKDKRVSDAYCDFVVPAVSLDDYNCKVFSNVYKRSQADDDLLAVDVALASSAAPTYFPSVSPSGSSRTYVDGGLFANDPSLVAAMFAHEEKGVAFGDMRVVRLGNGRVQSGLTARDYNALTEAGVVPPLLQMMFESQGSWTEAVLQSLCTRENTIRINPELAEFVELDDPDTAEQVLPARAEKSARETLQSVLYLLGYSDDSDSGMDGVCGTPPPITKG